MVMFVWSSVLSLAAVVLSGCEGGSDDEVVPAGDLAYADSASGSFSGETNGYKLSDYYTLPTNTIQPLSDAEMQELHDSYVTNYNDLF